MVSGMNDPAVQSVDPDQDAPYWVAFRNVNGIGPARFERMLAMFGTLRDAWLAPGRDLRHALGARALQQLQEAKGNVDPESDFAALQRDGITVLTLHHDAYPDLLREVPSPPPVIFLKGDIRDSDRRAVSIVGTRKATAYGRSLTRQIASDLARAGVTVVSGLALGIDGEAHKAALDTGGRTLAVLGSGVRHIYPQRHLQLAQRIEGQGAIISDFHPDAGPDAPNFPARNRIISALSLGVLVVEAPLRSGALITVQFAADQGRDVFAVPGQVSAASSAGCLRILRDGARLVRGADDILEDLRLGEVPKQVSLGMPDGLDDLSRKVLSALSSEPKHIDDISEASDLPVGSLASTLMTLELQGLVRNVGAQYYARSG